VEETDFLCQIGVRLVGVFGQGLILNHLVEPTGGGVVAVVDLAEDRAVVEEGEVGAAAGGVVAAADRPAVQRAAAVGLAEELAVESVGAGGGDASLSNGLDAAQTVVGVDDGGVPSL